LFLFLADDRRLISRRRSGRTSVPTPV
jgi:hypothetical protein